MRDKIKFYGVRGSIAVPGAETSGVGGNTSCVEVRLGSERVILDGGTGLRALGLEAGGGPVETTILFSHLHWDHIQGIPFFGPLYHPDSRITLAGPVGLEEALRKQMSGPNFPVGMEAMAAEVDFAVIEPGAVVSVGEVTVATAALNHPGGAIGFRLSRDGRTVAYVCDNEHREGGFDFGVVQLAKNADVLIFDAQYLPEEYSDKIGWGHSTYAMGAALARLAGARRLVLTHHEPARTDPEVAEMEARARGLFESTWAAREGMVCDLEDDAEPLPLYRFSEAQLAPV